MRDLMYWLSCIVVGMIIGWIITPDWKCILIPKSDLELIYAEDFCGNDDCRQIISTNKLRKERLDNIIP